MPPSHRRRFGRTDVLLSPVRCTLVRGCVRSDSGIQAGGCRESLAWRRHHKWRTRLDRCFARRSDRLWMGARPMDPTGGMKAYPVRKLLICDEDAKGFYEKLGFKEDRGLTIQRLQESRTLTRIERSAGQYDLVPATFGALRSASDRNVKPWKSREERWTLTSTVTSRR